jgi:membrane protein required for colicin V production
VNWLDILLTTVIAASLIGGFVKGFARTAIGLTALLFGVVGGFWFYGTVAAYLREFIDSRRAANIIGFLLILLAFTAAGALLGALVAKLLKLVRLSWLDRGIGGAFGLVRGLLYAALLVLLMMAFSPDRPPQAVADSRIAPYAMDTAGALAAAAPYEVKEGFRRSYKRVREIWAEAMKKGVRRLPRQTI